MPNPFLEKDRPNVYQIIYEASTERTTVFISDQPDPANATKIVNYYQLKTRKELNFYFQALMDNIGANYVGITHIENADGTLKQILMGRLTFSVPLDNADNITVVNATPSADAMKVAFVSLPSGSISTQPQNDSKVILQGQSVVMKRGNVYYFNRVQPAGVGDETYNFKFMLNGVLQTTLGPYGVGVGFDAPNPTFTPYDTIIIERVGAAATHNLNWNYQRLSGDGQLTIYKGGVVTAQTTPGALGQSGTFLVAAGNSIHCYAFSNLGVNSMLVRNETDNVVLYNDVLQENDFTFVAAAGKDYSVQVANHL